jgi:hypothetical protein
VFGLLLKGRYSGPYVDLVRSYGGNVVVSSSVYFLLTRLPIRHRLKRLMTAGLGLATVELFEATDGFGVMSNTYDPVDFLANAAGIGVALLVDVLASRTGDSERVGG